MTRTDFKSVAIRKSIDWNQELIGMEKTIHQKSLANSFLHLRFGIYDRQKLFSHKIQSVTGLPRFPAFEQNVNPVSDQRNGSIIHYELTVLGRIRKQKNSDKKTHLKKDVMSASAADEDDDDDEEEDVHVSHVTLPTSSSAKKRPRSRAATTFTRVCPRGHPSACPDKDSMWGARGIPRRLNQRNFGFGPNATRGDSPDAVHGVVEGRGGQRLHTYTG